MVFLPEGQAVFSRVVRVEELDGDLFVTHRSDAEEPAGSRKVAHFTIGRWLRVEMIP